ncbi:uncharacterized protein N7483_005442 [Penicillium malachiteum]|uniref:uncharacterized protein n=1 Tax=Penicillium malachiteum TaxID=1324776 RepID=UPI0025481A64|nr:uncharacterized protein N7483_005442 [Penicillium malachiteum]KAJ5730934.1 hypothetical protein N7483_005442 [Penicillium malachiteum]
MTSTSGTDPSHTPDIVPPNKVAIPRIAGVNHVQSRKRSARACEPCRHRKIKCDGIKPTCGQCAYHKSRCNYEDIKRIRDAKQIKSLASNVNRYEKLLRSIEGEVDSPTSRKIRKALKFNDGDPSEQAEGDQSDSSASVGSLEAVDVVAEDLNRNENTRASGFFGKNSEVSWIQRLENTTQRPINDVMTGSGMNSVQRNDATNDTPLATMNYHLDDLDIPPVDRQSDPSVIPARELADEYFNAYMILVDPFFHAIRKSTFTAQYINLFDRRAVPSLKWLAILNMIFAIGCWHCRLMNHEKNEIYDNEVVFLTRARQLSLNGNTLFEHTTLQQVQFELLISLYLLCEGQLNRASKFADMAVHSAVSLGVNLRLVDGRDYDEAKEARCRLWWSIYSLQHLLSSMHGRASSVGEALSSLHLPIPAEEESFNHPDISRLFQDEEARESDLCAMLFEKLSKSHSSPAWTLSAQPCPSLFFHYMVDLALISQSVLNKVYSIEGIREGSTQTEYRIQKYSIRMDRWLTKLPPCYQFHLPEAGPWHLNHSMLDDETALFTRERVCLAMSYYSGRITLSRPCLSLNYSRNPGYSVDKSSRDKLRAELAAQCLQASCSLISIFPDKVDIAWLARVTPSWAVLHFLMQSTIAILLGLSYGSFAPTDSQNLSNNHIHANAHGQTDDSSAGVSGIPHPTLLETDLSTAFAICKKAGCWMYAMASVDAAAKRAFILCDSVVRKIAPRVNVDLNGWPSVALLIDEMGDKGRGDDDHPIMRMDELEELVDFETTFNSEM